MTYEGGGFLGQESCSFLQYQPIFAEYCNHDLRFSARRGRDLRNKPTRTQTAYLVSLFEEIIRLGKERGMTQAEIAECAGLPKEILTRAKRNPNMGLQNFARLARVVGMKPGLVSDDPLVERILRGDFFER